MAHTTDNAPHRPDIGEGWFERLSAEFASPWFAELKAFLVEERRDLRQLLTETALVQ